MADQMQQRRSSASTWTTVNPILAQGEIGVELVTFKFKIGDGIKTWTQLSYASSGGGGASVWGAISGSLADQVDLTAALAAQAAATAQKQTALGFTPLNKAGDSSSGNLGAQSFSVNGGSTSGAPGLGFIELKAQAVNPDPPASGFLRFFSDLNARFGWITPQGFARVFRNTSLTGNRIYTLPDSDGSFVMKELQNFYTQQQVFTQTTLIWAATLVWDLLSNQSSVVTLTGNTVLANPLNMVAGGKYDLWVKQDSTGGRTLAFGSAFKFPGSTPIVLSTAPNAIDILSFSSDGSIMACVGQKAFG